MRSIEMTGKTVEDAVKAGLRELGCDSSEVTIDVLHMGSPGLFGMFGKLAKVRLTVKEEDPTLDFDLSDISLSLLLISFVYTITDTLYSILCQT